MEFKKKTWIIGISLVLIVLLINFTLISSKSLNSIEKKVKDEKVKDRDLIDNLRKSNTIKEDKGNVLFSYDSDKKEVMIDSKSNKNIFKANLITHYVNKISTGGPDTLVAEIYLSDYDSKEILKLFDSYELYDIRKNYELINRELTFKYGFEYYVEECLRDQCWIDKRIDWIEFEDLNEVPKGVKIGIFADTYLGEKIEWVPIIKGVKVYQWAAWEIGSAVYDGINISTQDDINVGIFFKSDGTNLYEVGLTNNRIYQYTLSDAWNLSSATYDNIYKNTLDTNPTGIFFKSDGTKMYELGYSMIYQYTLSDAWNLSSATYDNVNLSVQNYPEGLSISSDGEKLYIVGESPDLIYQYNCSDAWNLSSCSYDGINISTQDSYPYDLQFGSNGTKMYELGATNDLIYQYNCSDAWNLSSCSYDGINISTQNDGPSGLFFKSDGTKMYESDRLTDLIYQYTIVDVDPPSINIIEPQPINYVDNSSLDLNYTVNDLSSLVDSCWYNVKNSTGDIIIDNTTLTDCQNTTFSLPGGDIDYTLTLYSNDTLNNEGYSNVSFGIRTNGPVIVLNYPTSNKHFKSENNIYFNYTAIDSDGLDTCELWGNWTGAWHKNYTWINPTNATMNYTSLNLTEGKYLYNIWCNDTLNNYQWGLNNLTFTIDLTYPIININAPVNSSSFTGLSTTVEYNISDDNINSCFFTLRNSSGDIHNYAENTSITCSEDGARTISVNSYGTYDIYLYGRDAAGNENVSTVRFISTAPPLSVGGSGGSSPDYVNVIAFTQDLLKGSYSDLERAKIYASFFKECTTEFTNKDCLLTTNEVLELCSLIEEDYGINIGNEDCSKFLDLYKNEEIKTIKVKSETFEEFGLIKDTEGIRILLEIKPYRLDPLKLRYTETTEINLEVKSNKPLLECSSFDYDKIKYNITCGVNSEVDTIGNVKIIFVNGINEEEFAQIIEGTLAWKAVEKEEVFYQAVSVRLLNLKAKTWWSFGQEVFPIGIVIWAAILIIIFYVFGINKKIKFK